MVNWLPDVSEVDRPGSSSASVAGLLTAKMGGMARSGIGCWVAAAMGFPCRSRAISILRRIVRATKAARVAAILRYHVASVYESLLFLCAVLQSDVFLQYRILHVALVQDPSSGMKMTV